MFIVNVTDSLTLRMLSARDAEPLFNAINNNRNYLKKWLPWVDDTQTIEDSTTFITNSFYTYNNRQGILAGVFLNKELIGMVSYNSLNQTTKIGTIGYWICENYQGQGIMSKAVKAMIDYGFTQLDLNKIEIRVAAGNERSAAIPKRFHFQLEGTIRDAEWLYDHFVDHLLFGLLKVDYLK